MSSGCVLVYSGCVLICSGYVLVCSGCVLDVFWLCSVCVPFNDWNLNYLNLSLNQASIYYFILKLWHVKFKLRRFTALRGEVDFYYVILL